FFLGGTGMRAVREAGLRRQLIGLEMVYRAVARHSYVIRLDGKAVVVVTSGSYCPTVERYIAVGYVPTGLAAVGTELEVEVRGRGQRARVAKTPFHSPRVRK